MKHTVILAVLLILTALVIAVLPLSGEEGVYRDVIRLHILAASDSPGDQADKLAVRDAILRDWGASLSGAATVSEAEATARNNLPAMERTARETLTARGCDEPVRVTLTRERYPRRDYGTFSLPAGEYLSLRVLIGEAAGHNWWCVLYPPLCLDAAAAGDEPLSDAEWDLMTENGAGHYTVRFRILELLSGWFGEDRT